MRFDALSSAPYRRFWLGSIASVGSTQLYFISKAWLVFELSGSALDLGFLGPGFRLLPGISYWMSTMARAQVDRFESRLDALNESQGGITPPGGFNLGIIDRSDVIVSLDGHYMWAIPLGLFFLAGAGLSAHFLDGSRKCL